MIDMIREIKVSELDGLMELYTHLHNNPFPEKDERLTSVWQTILDDKNHHIIVAQENGKIVSSCVCLIVPNLTHNRQPYALIENVVTDPLFRSKGYATKCLDYARELAIKEGCYKIMLLTGSKEESTHRFYKNAGYNSNDKTAYIMWL